MSDGPHLPSSIYFGAASGFAYPTFYVSATNTNAASYIETVGVVGSASLTADAPVTLQFNLPETIPTGTCKLRSLAWSQTGGSLVSKLTISDGQTAVGANIGATTLTAEAQITFTFVTADLIVENKTNLTTAPTANNILTVLATFNHTGWTQTAASAYQFSLVWE